MSLILDEHREYLADAVRLDAFRRAIREVVRPGAVVADLGSGTGILGLFACEAGASRVYAIEAGGIIEVARAVAARNGFGDRVVWVHGLSTEVDLPERVDVILTDQIGRFGFEAGLFEYIADARRRFLKPGGTIVPARVDLMLAPLADPEMRDRVRFWCGRPAGFDLSPAYEHAANTGYPKALSPDQVLCEPVVAARADVRSMTTDPLALEATFNIERRGVVDGIAGWFSAALSEHVTMTNSPCAGSRIDRRNVYLPIDSTPVEPGDRVHVRMRIRPAEAVVTWRGAIVRGAGAAEKTLGSFRRSTVAGMLLCREDLARQHPAFAPRLTPRGRARLTVLELCDGARTLADVERGVFERHRNLFETPAQADAFVAEVVLRYTR